MKQETERYLRIEEVAILINCSVKTINNWYAFKKQNPDNEMTKLLPDFIQKGARQTRYWKLEDIPFLIQFKASVPQGRSGIMGSVTQKYYHKNKEEVK